MYINVDLNLISLFCCCWAVLVLYGGIISKAQTKSWWRNSFVSERCLKIHRSVEWKETLQKLLTTINTNIHPWILTIYSLLKSTKGGTVISGTGTITSVAVMACRFPTFLTHRALHLCPPICFPSEEYQYRNWLVVSTHLKNTTQNWIISPSN